MSEAARVNWRGWLIVGALVLLTTVINGIVTAGLPALDRDILNELGISRASLKAREAVLLLTTGFSGLLIGFLARKVSPRVIAPSGLVLLAAALFAYAHAANIAEIYVIYVVLGLCAASSHVVVIILLIRQFFTRQRALATSLALTGISVGSMIFPGIVVRISEVQGWRGTLTTLSVLPLIVLVPGVLMLIGRAPNTGTVDEPQRAVVTTRRPLPMAQLALLLFITFAVFFASNSMLLNLFLYLQDLGFDNRAAAAGVSTFFVVGLLAKFGTGWAAERWGVYRVWMGQQVVLLAGGAVLTLAMPGTVIAGVALLGVGWAGCYVLTQVVMADFFAGPDLGKFAGAFILFEAVAAGSGVWSAGLVFDLLGSYRGAFLLNCGLVILAIIAGRFFTAAPATVAGGGAVPAAAS